jgi:hypothetical protein
MSPQNLTNVYNQNPTLQGQYSLQQYLDLFGGSSTGTTTNASGTGGTPKILGNPVPASNQGIINQNINQYQNQGGGAGIQTLDPYSRPQGTPLDPNSFLGRTVQGVKDFGSSVVDKFSGLPGVEQGKGLIANIMDNTLVGRLAAARNPLNPKASNYNPDLQGQIDMLEGTTGTRVFGTSDNLQFEDAAMIGRDPNSGLAKYGPGSVLSGQNVVSGFGTNDYVGQLQNYIDKMMSYKTLTTFQQAKLDRALAEKAAAEKKALEEFNASQAAALTREMARQNKRDNTGGYQAGYGGDFMDGGNRGRGNDPDDKGGSDSMGSSRDGGLMGYGGKSGTPRYKRGSYFNGGIVSLRRR